MSGYLTCTRLVDVQPTITEFLWRPYLPTGKVVLLEGHPGVGKSYLSLDIAAKMSSGEPFDGDFEGRPPGNVVLMSIEDGLGDTVAPRLIKQGADTRRIIHVAGHGCSIDFGTEDAWGRLSEKLAQISPRLIVVDPLMGFVGRGTDVNRSNEVRIVMGRLAELAERLSCVVLCVRHLTKSSRDAAILRGSGSIDFAAAARSILLIGRHPEIDSRSVLVHSKSNLSSPGPSRCFEIGEDGLVYQGETGLTAAELLQPEQPVTGNRTIDSVCRTLSELLSSGPRTQSDVLELFTTIGVSRSTVYRAKEQMKVQSRKSGMSGGWLWELPYGLN